MDTFCAFCVAECLTQFQGKAVTEGFLEEVAQGAHMSAIVQFKHEIPKVAWNLRSQGVWRKMKYRKSYEIFILGWETFAI